jgi:hypothetical protein
MSSQRRCDKPMCDTDGCVVSVSNVACDRTTEMLQGLSLPAFSSGAIANVCASRENEDLQNGVNAQVVTARVTWCCDVGCRKVRKDALQRGVRRYSKAALGRRDVGSAYEGEVCFYDGTVA